MDTLRVLLCEPGRLTAEAVAARPTRLAAPLVLCVGCAAAFFASVALASMLDPATSRVRDRTPADSAVMTLVDSGTFVAAPEVRGNAIVQAIGPGTTWTLVTHQALLRDILATAVPRAAFLLVPFFAAFTLAAWRKASLGYREHLVFALHLHAAGFLSLVVPVVLRPLRSGLLVFTASVGVLVYTTWYTVVAARVALGGTKREVNVRLGVAGLLYMPVAMAATFVVALIAMRAL